MERFWEQCIFKYLRAEPEDHYFLLVCICCIIHSKLRSVFLTANLSGITHFSIEFLA